MQEITGAKPVRDANFIFALKALAVRHSFGKRIQLGATPSEGSTAIEPALKQVSYASCAEGSTRDCDHFRLHAAACGFLL